MAFLQCYRRLAECVICVRPLGWGYRFVAGSAIASALSRWRHTLCAEGTISEAIRPPRFRSEAGRTKVALQDLAFGRRFPLTEMQVLCSYCDPQMCDTMRSIASHKSLQFNA